MSFRHEKSYFYIYFFLTVTKIYNGGYRGVKFHKIFGIVKKVARTYQNIDKICGVD